MEMREARRIPSKVMQVVTGELPVFLSPLPAPPQVWASLVAQTVNNLPVMQETRVQSLGQEDPLAQGMATCSSKGRHFAPE